MNIIVKLFIIYQHLVQCHIHYYHFLFFSSSSFCQSSLYYLRGDLALVFHLSARVFNTAKPGGPNPLFEQVLKHDSEISYQSLSQQWLCGFYYSNCILLGKVSQTEIFILVSYQQSCQFQLVLILLLVSFQLLFILYTSDQVVS